MSGHFSLRRIPAAVLFLLLTLILCATHPKELLADNGAKALHQDLEHHETAKVEEKESLSASLLVRDTTTTLHKIHADLVQKYKLEAPWREKWDEARRQITTMQVRAQTLSDNFNKKRDLLLYVSTCERQFSQLLPSYNRYQRWASLMEAVRNRIILIRRDLDRDLTPLYTITAEVEKLHQNVQSLSTSSKILSRDNTEFLSYQKNLEDTEKQLEKILEQQRTDLEPAARLRQQLKNVEDEITQKLPTLWKNYYLQSPLTWLDSSAWTYLHRQLDIVFRAFEMRRALELPSDANGWRVCILRALILGILFTLALIFLRRRSWIPTDTNPNVDHIFRVSLPWICLGITLLLSSFTPHGESFHLFLGLGNICIILGQIHLAWDLRLVSNPDVQLKQAPMLRLFPLTCIAYVLLYLPLLPIVLLLLWLFFLALVLLWRRSWPELSIGNLRLEKNIRTFDGFVLWLCLLLTLCGLPILSMIVYLFSVSFSLATELCIGGLDNFNYLNQNQPSEGIRAIISNIVVSLTAPIIMLITITSVLLWVATLPGGMQLMSEYLFKNISIGSAEFNFIHVLIIISAFFLTKAVVVTGSRYLAKIISNRKNNIDTTLITPAQTAYTYFVWIIFALFVLHILDIDLKNAAMVMTGLSVGIGMGLQGIVNNFFSGLLLIFGRMLQVGDVIEVGGISGRVERISVRHTLVRTYDNAHIYVPNSEFISGHLVNWSRNDSTVRANVNVGVAYGTDTELVIKTLLDIVKKQEGILRYPEPTVSFSNFGDNTLDFSVYFWVNRFDDRLRTSTQVRLEIEKEFSRKRIEIAYPQLDVHVSRKLPTSRPGKSLLRHSPRLLKRALRKEHSSEQNSQFKADNFE